MSDEQEREWHEHIAKSEARGKCPYSGLTFQECKGWDVCDCFAYPEHEHYRDEWVEP